MALNTTQPFELVLSKDVTVPVRPTLAKKRDNGVQNTYWALLTPTQNGRKDTGFGVPVSFPGGLPSNVTLISQDGSKIVLPLTPAPATYIDRDTKVEKARKNPAVKHQAVHTLMGVEKKVTVTVSDLGDGRKNVKASITGVSGGGGGSTKTFTASDL